MTSGPAPLIAVLAFCLTAFVFVVVRVRRADRLVRRLLIAEQVQRGVDRGVFVGVVNPPVRFRRRSPNDGLVRPPAVHTPRVLDDFPHH
jgi:hypothetical protein